MAYGKFAERVVDDALDRDLSSFEGAEHLAKCIRAYWQKKGVTVETRIESVGRDTGGGTVFAVKTVGIPLANRKAV